MKKIIWKVKDFLKLLFGNLKKLPLDTNFIYYVSDKGKLFRKTNKGLKELKGWLEESKKGLNKWYYRVNIKIEGTFKKYYLHRLILMGFERLPKEDEVGRHLNDNSLDNRPVNLLWGTQEENMMDKMLNNLI